MLLLWVATFAGAATSLVVRVLPPPLLLLLPPLVRRWYPCWRWA